MLEDRRTVTVGLDVHKSSVRLAAVSRGEVLRERTLVYDHDELLGEISAWPGARVCQEAGPTGFGLHRALLAAAGRRRRERDRGAGPGAVAAR
jgi:hypothetical protein